MGPCPEIAKATAYVVEMLDESSQYSSEPIARIRDSPKIRTREIHPEKKQSSNVETAD